MLSVLWRHICVNRQLECGFMCKRLYTNVVIISICTMCVSKNRIQCVSLPVNCKNCRNTRYIRTNEVFLLPHSLLSVGFLKLLMLSWLTSFNFWETLPKSLIFPNKMSKTSFVTHLSSQKATDDLKPVAKFIYVFSYDLESRIRGISCMK